MMPIVVVGRSGGTVTIKEPRDIAVIRNAVEAVTGPAGGIAVGSGPPTDPIPEVNFYLDLDTGQLYRQD